MGLDLWFRQDVARILAATWETMQATAVGTRCSTVTTAEDHLARAYAQGFEDALRAVGVAFGLAASRSAVRRVSDGLEAGQPDEASRWPVAPPLGDYE
jgi:hypothetical protein